MIPKKRETLTFQFFNVLCSFLDNIHAMLHTSLYIQWFKKLSEMSKLIIRKSNSNCLLQLASKHTKLPKKLQKSTFFDNSILIFVQSTAIFVEQNKFH